MVTCQYPGPVLSGSCLGANIPSIRMQLFDGQAPEAATLQSGTYSNLVPCYGTALQDCSQEAILVR